MEYYKKIVGDRIYLSPVAYTEEALDKFTEWMNDFNVTDYTGRSSEITTYLNEKEWLDRTARKTETRDFNIIDIKTNKLIGSVGLVNFKWIPRSATLGIFIGDDEYRSNGYGTEAIKLILEFAFKYLNLHSVNLDLIEANERAHKCYLKCGFKYTGMSRDAIFLNGKYYNKLHMDILESEFEGDYIRNKNI